MTTRPILLDTCAAIWLGGAGPLSPDADRELQAAEEQGMPIYLSPITAWEIGMLVSKGRVAMTIPPLAWFRTFTGAGFRLADLSPEILVESSFLPGPTLRDPADRIIAATARALGYRLMTRDQPLLALAQAGHLSAIAC